MKHPTLPSTDTTSSSLSALAMTISPATAPYSMWTEETAAVPVVKMYSMTNLACGHQSAAFPRLPIMTATPEGPGDLQIQTALAGIRTPRF